MKLELNDLITTEEGTYAVTGWMHGKEMPKDTQRIERGGIVIYPKEERENERKQPRRIY